MLNPGEAGANAVNDAAGVTDNIANLIRAAVDVVPSLRRPSLFLKARLVPASALSAWPATPS